MKLQIQGRIETLGGAQLGSVNALGLPLADLNPFSASKSPYLAC